MGKTIKYNGKLNILGNTIKNYRLEKDLSLEQLSNKLQLLGITLQVSSIDKIEKNQRAIKDFELAGLSYILEFSIDKELFDFKLLFKQ